LIIYESELYSGLHATKGKIMHFLLFSPFLASDALVAPSGAAVIVILAVVAALRGR
jgi:hypothetical protein